MMGSNKNTEQDAELDAMATVYRVLSGLDRDAQDRVLDYVIRRLSLSLRISSSHKGMQQQPPQIDFQTELPSTERAPSEPVASAAQADVPTAEDLEGISPVAQKWMRRNGLSSEQLCHLFSLGIDEIDLVARSVPGKSTREKFLNVVLLQGIGSYLGSGAPRVDATKVRQTAAHYGADPGRNLWNYVKSAAADISGSSATGFTLTAKGLTAATELIKQMTGTN